jgi:hypothetical protein
MNDNWLDSFLRDCKMRSTIDIPFEENENIRDHDLKRFFEFVLYHVSSYENHFLESCESVLSKKNHKICMDDVGYILSTVKKRILDASDESEMIKIYERYKKFLSAIYDTVIHSGSDCMFIIYYSNIPESMFCIINYKNVWTQKLRENTNDEYYDIFLLYEGYVQVHCFQNKMKHSELNNNTIYVSFFSLDA